MAALEAAIHVDICAGLSVDGRVKPGHDELSLVFRPPQFGRGSRAGF